MTEQAYWYIVKIDGGNCEIQALDPAQISVYPKHWGAFFFTGGGDRQTDWFN